MFSTNTSKFGELSTTTDISKVRLVTIPNKDIKISPVPDFTPDNSHLVGVTSENNGILVPASELIPGIAFNSYDGDPKPMVSGEVWNELEQLREAFTAGGGFTLPHFRYVADDYFWKSIVGDKAFYYLTSMDLVTWPIAWAPGTSNPALHLEWLRAPEQTQIFKFIDGTSSISLGTIILKNRTEEMVSQDPMEVRVNECSTSTKLKEVRVLVKSKDASPLYINFPGANVSVSILQKADTTITPNVSSTLANIPFASNTSIDNDAVCDWKTLTINTAAEKLKDVLNVGQEAICPGTVYLNAGKVKSVENCFTGQYTPGSVIPDVRLNLSGLNTSYSFYPGFPLKKENILTAINNLSVLNAKQAIGSFRMLNSVTMTDGVVTINGINVPTDTSAPRVASKINASPNFNTWLSANGWGTTVDLTAKKPGILGNRITLTTTDPTNFPVSGATLTGGTGASGASDGSLPILDIGIDTALGAAVGDTAWMPMDEDIQKAVEEKNGLWAFNWHPISVEGGDITAEY